MNINEASPLSQRQSGRRQRREARHNNNESLPANNTTTSNGNNNNVTPQQQQLLLPNATVTVPRKGPSQELEQRIAESINQRIQSNAAAKRLLLEQDTTTSDHNDHDDGITEILGNYEYLDHTADIQLHSWGSSLQEAMEALVMALFGYMTQLSLIEVNDHDSHDYGSLLHVEAHDMTSLVFMLLQEWLCIFHETRFVPKYVTIHALNASETFTVDCSGYGETMKLDKHLPGTEVKAVTFSNLQVVSTKDDNDHDRWDIWVILDI